MSEWQELITWANTEAGRAWPWLTGLGAAVAGLWKPIQKRLAVWRVKRAAALHAIIREALGPTEDAVVEVQRLTGQNHHADPEKPTMPDRLADLTEVVQANQREAQRSQGEMQQSLQRSQREMQQSLQRSQGEMQQSLSTMARLLSVHIDHSDEKTSTWDDRLAAIEARIRNL